MYTHTQHTHTTNILMLVSYRGSTLDKSIASLNVNHKHLKSTCTQYTHCLAIAITYPIYTTHVYIYILQETHADRIATILCNYVPIQFHPRDKHITSHAYVAIVAM